MTLYFSEKPFTKELTDVLQKEYPRSEIKSNFFNVPRANTINYGLLLNYFSCALAKTHNSFLAALSLPEDLENKIPSWYIKSTKEVFLDSLSGPRGQNAYRNNVFIIKFNFYTDEKHLSRLPEAKNQTPEEIITGELVEIKHALEEYNFEPLAVLKEFYQDGEVRTQPALLTSRHLAEIITFPR